MDSWRLYLIVLVAILLLRSANGDTDEEYHALMEKAIKEVQKQQNSTQSLDWCLWTKPAVGIDFSCNVIQSYSKKAQNVNELTPYDIKVVGAMGDSVTAAFGAKACNLISDIKEYRGVSWTIGGDGDISTTTTIPNIIKQYNPNVIGYSVKTGRPSSSNSNLDRAVSGAISEGVPSQARELVDLMKKDERIDFENDWKLVSLWIGGNNLCWFCRKPDKHSPENYVFFIKEALDYLMENSPRTFVNLVQIIDITRLKDIKQFPCGLIHSIVCPCKGADETSEAATEYQEALAHLVASGRYDRDDFTVVLQPFMEGIEVPRKPNGSPDMDYFAPDCFHFSTLGHKEGAVALWNNMIEPIGEKTSGWTLGGPLKCPVAPYYFRTKQNSVSQAAGLGAEDTSDQKFPQPSDNNVAIIAGAVVGVAVVLIGLVVITIAAGVIVRKKNQLSIRAENSHLIMK